MNARQVHAVLAAGVENPTLIAGWRADPARLARLGIDPASLDLDALWKFSGLTIKVRHNGVRQQLPCTFRLLAAAGLEISLFADYAASRKAAGQPYAMATTQRAHDLVRFITGWIDPSAPVHVLLGDIARHELAMVILGAGEAAPQTAPKNRAGSASPGQCLLAPLPHPNALKTARRGPRFRGAADDRAGAVRASAVPWICGRIVLHEMHGNPLHLAGALRHNTPRLPAVGTLIAYYGYWRRDDDPGVAVLELDEFGYYLLSLVDGRRSVADLSRALGGRRRPTRRFTRSLEQFEQLGLLRFADRRRQDEA